MQRCLIPIVALACTPPPDRLDVQDPTQPGVVVPDTVRPEATASQSRVYPTPEALEAVCDPTGNALRFQCTVDVDPPQPVVVTVSPADGYGPTRTYPSLTVGTDEQVDVYFLEPQREYEWTVSATHSPEGLQRSGAFTSGRLPAAAQASLDVTGASSVPYVGLVTPCGGTIALIFDTATGAPVWYQDFGGGGLSLYSDQLTFTEDRTVLTSDDAALTEVDLMGRTLLHLEDGVDFDRNLHHDVHKANGYVYALFNETVGAATLDGVLVVDAAAQAVVDVWASWEHLPIPQGASGDWMHSNAIWVDGEGNAMLSMLSRDAIVKFVADPLSPDFGTHLWTLSGNGDQQLGDDFVLSSSSSDPANFWTQHNVNLRPDGRVGLLDNRWGSPSSRGLVIGLDEGAGTANVDEVHDPGRVCGPQGSAFGTPAGHTMVACAGDEAAEFDETGAQVWAAEASCVQFAFASIPRWTPLDW